jgi:hypothetical protein
MLNAISYLPENASAMVCYDALAILTTNDYHYNFNSCSYFHACSCGAFVQM